MTDSKSLDSSTRLTRQVLSTLSIRPLHRARNWSKADVYLCEWPPDSGQRIVVKDLRRCPLWFRIVIGRSFLKREWNALCALRDMPEVPLPIARPDADSIAMEYRAGKSVKRFKHGLLPRDVLQRIEEIVARLHARGVTHGDLHRKNVMIGEDGAVTLIDWATACVFEPQAKGVAARAFQEWRALDNRALAKLKQYHFPHTLQQHEKQILTQNGSALYELVKRLRRIVQYVSRKRR
jgi:tRNA A-37 threonylcarbamoyl transferase component Bud32